MVKILMLHDCAHVGFELSKALNKLGVKVQLEEYFTRHGFDLKKGYNLAKMFVKSQFTDADIIHSHFLGSASFIARLSGLPYVTHIHGSDVRNKKLSRIQKDVLKHAAAILYATPDLKPFVPKEAIYLKTPVGPQFKPLGLSRTIEKAARLLCYEKKQPKMVNFSDVPYSEMPQYLNTIKTFYDRKTINSLSKTALEALACGCKVIHSSLGVFSVFNEDHRSFNVAKELLEIYKGVN